jgi:hypothetical protein
LLAVAAAFGYSNECAQIGIRAIFSVKEKKKKQKKKQIGMIHSREDIGRGCQPAAQVEGEQ